MGFIGRMYREGTTLKIEGVAGAPKLLLVEQFGFTHYFNGDIFQWIDALAAAGVNGMRVFGFWPFGRGAEEEPYVKIGGGYDLNAFNQRFFDYLAQWVAYAHEKGIVALYELFDTCGIKWQDVGAFNPFYHLVGSSTKNFSNLNNARLFELQKQYIRKVVESVKPDVHHNVMFGIMNEYVENKEWHYAMSRYVKSLAPKTLIAGSEEGSTAADDPTVDIWFVHKGRYDLKTGASNVPADANDLRQQTGNRKIIGFSTDGFMPEGTGRENPTDMRRLAQDVNRANLQLFGFLDQKAYSGKNQAYGVLSRLNIETYKAIVSEFHPTPLATQTAPLPEGFLDVFQVYRLPSTHPNAFYERGGKAIRATTRQGFLCFGQYKTGYPTMPLKAYFSILVDNNTADDRNLLILDVYDHQSDRVIGKRVITRKDFAKANEFCLFEFDFMPPSAQANMEFRVYYMGHSYALADKIAVIDPAKISIRAATDIP